MVIDVAVGIIWRDGQVFLAYRSSEKHQGDLWEFPGGKCETNELPENALQRELKEEIGIDILRFSFFDVLIHDYGDKTVRLHFYLVDGFTGEPDGCEGQNTQWVDLASLSLLRFPAANQPIVDRLVSGAAFE